MFEQFQVCPLVIRQTDMTENITFATPLASGNNSRVYSATCFCYNEHEFVMSKFLCIKIMGSNVKKFGYNKHQLAINSKVNITCELTFMVRNGPDPV